MITRQQYVAALEDLAEGVRREAQQLAAGADLVAWWRAGAERRWHALNTLCSQAEAESPARARQWFTDWRAERWASATGLAG